MLKPILACTFVGLVILTECVFAWMLIPSQKSLEEWAKAKAQVGETKHEDGHGDKDHHDSGHSAHAGGHEVEVDLGKYNVIVHQPAANVTLRINFHLIGTVGEKDHEPFEHLLEKNNHRLRDHVIYEIRNSTVEDLTDPGLALLKRKILAKSNDLLGKPILHTVVFSDFSFIEQ
jgi:flagellar FliL protein